MKYDSLYSVRKAWLEAIGGDATGADSVYTLSLRILKIYKENPPQPSTKYTISFNIDDAEGTAPDSIEAEEGEVIILPSSEGFDKYGCDFKYWRNGEIYYEAGDEYTVTENVEFQAVYEEKEISKFLKLISVGDGTISMEHNYGHNPKIQYSLNDGEDWTVWDGSAIQTTNKQEVCFKGTNKYGFNKKSSSNIQYSRFVLGGLYDIEGHFSALLNESDTISEIPEYCFYSLFDVTSNYNNGVRYAHRSIINATGNYGIRANACENMFGYNYAMISTPQLPCRTLSSYTYERMFIRCTALKKVSDLPATIIGDGTYKEMFSLCFALEEPPVLGHSSGGESAYYKMFNECSSLKRTPILPALTLNRNMYYQMFYNCKSLERIECYAEDCSAINSTYEWIPSSDNLTSDGLFVQNIRSTWSDGVSGKPSDWKVIYYDRDAKLYWLDKGKTQQCDKDGNPI